MKKQIIYCDWINVIGQGGDQGMACGVDVACRVVMQPTVSPWIWQFTGGGVVTL